MQDISLITSSACLLFVLVVLASPRPIVAFGIAILLLTMVSRTLGITRQSITRFLSEKGLSPQYGDARKSATVQALAAMAQYRKNCNRNLMRKNNLYATLKSSQKSLASRAGYSDRQKAVGEGIRQNQKFFNEIIEFGKSKYDLTDVELTLSPETSHYQVIELLGHLQRDWSCETERERAQLTEPIVSALTKHSDPNKGNVEILVPGSGLCAVAYELARQGYNVDACEFSGLMDIVAEYMTQGNTNPIIDEIHPFVSETSYLQSQDSQTRSVKLRYPSLVPLNGALNLKFGDFTKLIDQPKRYDHIVTVFFIDTAENIFTYLEAIKKLLKPNGTWINYGPLKWGTAPKVEFTWEELTSVIEMSGWKLTTKFHGENVYIPNQYAMWKGVYHIEGFVARLNSE